MHRVRLLAHTIGGWQAAHQVSELDDERLHDIGIRRQDVRRALKGRLQDNPTEFLSEAAAGRYAGWQATPPYRKRAGSSGPAPLSACLDMSGSNLR